VKEQAIISNKTPKEEYQRLKYRGCGCENVKFQMPKVVSIPSGNTTKAFIPFQNEIIMSLSGGFESGLGEGGGAMLRTRLLKGRSYAKQEPFQLSNIMVPPSLRDLSYPPSSLMRGFWVGLPARILTAVVAYFVFPYLTSFLESFVTMQPEDLDAITSKFGPGVSILYGTFISLTLSILYNRIKDIQAIAAKESAILTLVTRNLVSIFKDDKALAVEAAQCCADQIRTMVRSSRGAELLELMYTDPYARIVELLDYREEQLYQELGGLGAQSVSALRYGYHRLRGASHSGQR
jgi:hypothetical protein